MQDLKFTNLVRLFKIFRCVNHALLNKTIRKDKLQQITGTEIFREYKLSRFVKL